MTTRDNLTGIINRLLIIFLLFSLIVTAGSFILRHSITTRLDKLSGQLNAPSPQNRISALLLDLDMAENSFQKASSNGDAKYLTDYQKKTDNIFREISAITEHYRSQSASNLPESREQLARILAQKLEISAQLFKLRTSFDSLVRVTTIERLHQKSLTTPKGQKEEIQTDSVITTHKEASKSGFFSRLKDAFRGTQSVKVITLRKKSKATNDLSEKQARALLAELGSQYGRLAQSGQALVLANLNLLTSLRQLVGQLQDIDRISSQRSREATLKAYASATRDLNTFSGIALAAMLVFIFLLLVYVRRATWAERRIRVETKRAIQLAGQKSEILAIMSHEIRNKLMAINGAVYTLKRIGLSQQQEQKVNTINLASGLVLETVNNVLDASKLEQGYAESRKSGPFVPGNAIADAVEAMRFMAENKNISLTLQQDTSTAATIIGDSFRLKQVMLNLLSNAIKYTEIGGVAVKSELTNEYVLKVEVKDTGAGISKNQQDRLFTPYYQAEGHKPGTGLGLYLCREIIIKQGGEITLESEPGKGTTITFSIPYETSDTQ
ncbi:HAMP domain-containing histidine kinase [Mucilaginibacter sp. RS28]|uniref:histidine kinase n=1 Tax=Mucilaginibacter straminoryzae TaxID=2932774 RepID=A0A9X2B866_9SPHI|nr:HAMP domain-containing sensor histidine kinase [Mucilaginibacter straminoryzae]MCJ8208395.1 HAMP domain-containing histidine kinase [Mucilaginibacter straminoryzae]